MTWFFKHDWFFGIANQTTTKLTKLLINALISTNLCEINEGKEEERNKTML